MLYIFNKVKDMIDFNKIGFVLASKYRRLILEALLKRPMTVSEIAEEYGINKRSLYGPAKSLRHNGLVFKKERTYTITEEGAEVINFIHERASVKYQFPHGKAPQL